MVRQNKRKIAGKAPTFPVVGIGASAGGLPAILALLQHVPKDSGLAFVLVTHLKPNTPSHMAEILASKCALPVVEAIEGSRIEADHVYVIPPDCYITLHEGRLRLAHPDEPRAFRRPIDLFLQSLAHDLGRRAICIVLSGTGADGSAGLRTIKAEGGFAIAQSPESAEFEGMPRAAIATGLIDLVLPPEEMAVALARVAAHPYVKADESPAGNDSQLNALLTLLYSRTRHDFRSYKKNTLLRRIYRRMGIAEKASLSEYADLVRQKPEEATALVRDLMISVSGFFRDPEAWAELDKKVIAPLVDERDDGQSIRVWVPGCATGEEAYSIGMLLLSRAQETQKNFEIKIFATDASDDVLRFAHNGIYPAGIAADMPRQMLDRFFVAQDDTFRVGKVLRDSVIFAPQNVLQDPPFTRLDLVSCRNLLIYLENDVQRRLMAIFHFALQEGGNLFLGPAESLSGEDQFFSPLSKKWRIYRRLPGADPHSAPFPLLPHEVAQGSKVWPATGRQSRRQLPDLAREALLEAYAPAAVIIDREFHILYFHGDTSPYLRQPPGAPSNDLLSMAHGGLRAKLRSLVQNMGESGQPASLTVRLRGEDGTNTPVLITASSLKGRRDLGGLLLVAFVVQSAGSADNEVKIPVDAKGGESTALESELNILREELRGTVEQMENSHEELKASHEEIMSMNEELQSNNEELETSKEELQSLNEELSTVNSQLQAKLEEIESRTNDMNNLLASSNIASLFLDVNMRIRWFTPSLGQLMELLPTDIGRPVAHFAHRFTERDLLVESQQVLQSLSPASAEVRDDSGRWYLREIMPFRTEENRIEGVVITFTNVTPLKEGERELREQKEFADKIIDTVRQPLLVLEPDLTIRRANRAFCEMSQVTAESAVNRSIYEVGNHLWEVPQMRRLLEEMVPSSSTFQSVEADIELSGSRRIMRLSACRLDGAPLILLAINDLTDDRMRERQQQMLSEELNHRVKNSLLTVQALANQTLKTSSSLAAFGERFRGRLHALAAGHDLVMRQRWRNTALQEIALNVLKPFMGAGDNQVSVKCDGVSLTPQQVVSWALLLHELATNAAKYGALSVPTGRVAVTVEHAGDRKLKLRWNESGGPAVEGPGQRGFGTELVLRIAQHDLSGHADFQYRPEGLLCIVTFPENGGE